MQGHREDQVLFYQTVQILLFTFSLIFFVTIFYGYFNLFAKSGYFLAIIGGSVLAIFAWFLARVVGQKIGESHGIAFLLLPLLLVSAFGVYNSLMLFLEGGQIISDTASSSEERFEKLAGLSRDIYAASGAQTHLNHVSALKQSLANELRNPLNCGQGSVASGIISEIQQELPDFLPESHGNGGCDRIEEVISNYNTTIDDLVQRANWNRPYLAWAVDAESSRADLDKIRVDASNAYSPEMLRGVSVTLEALDTKYRNLYFQITSQADSLNIGWKKDEIPSSLDIEAVLSLGNAFRLPYLFFDRMDRVSTWFYLAVALGFDSLMVFLFWLARQHRVRRPMVITTVDPVW